MKNYILEIKYGNTWLYYREVETLRFARKWKKLLEEKKHIVRIIKIYI